MTKKTKSLCIIPTTIYTASMEETAGWKKWKNIYNLVKHSLIYEAVEVFQVILITTIMKSTNASKRYTYWAWYIKATDNTL